MVQTMSVSIVISNWNGLELIKKHLSSVIKNSDQASIIIVDDHSSDESVAYIKKHYPDIEIVQKTDHEGFASTVNAGVERAKTDIVVLLNTDVEPEKDFLKPLMSHFSDRNVFAVACMDKSEEKGKIVLRGRGIGWWEKGFYIHKRGEVNKSDTAWISGGSGAFRRSMWNTLGGMDPIFNPFYWEDIDLSYRAGKRGYKILFESKSVVCHYHEKGIIHSNYTQKYIQQIAYRNQFIFIWKHVSFFYFPIHAFWTVIRLVQRTLLGNWNFFIGYLHALPLFPRVICGRFLGFVYESK